MDFVCECCGATFSRPPSAKARFCSRKCKATERAIVLDEKSCLACGKPLVQRSDETRTTFRVRTTCGGKKPGGCSYELRQRTRLAVPHQSEVTCERCGAKFTMFTSQATTRHYCSLECKNKAREIWRNCDHCGKPYRPNKKAGPGGKQFCGVTCMGGAKRKRVDVTCAQCGTAFELQPYQVVPGRRNYCNRQCKTAGLATLSPTSIETETYAALRDLGVQFIAQAPVLTYAVDALLVDLNTVIEVQGDYFYCNPDVYPDGPKDEMQKRAITKDRRRFARLRSAGFKVVQLWEKDIREHGAETLLRDALGDKLTA